MQSRRRPAGHEQSHRATRATRAARATRVACGERADRRREPGDGAGHHQHLHVERGPELRVRLRAGEVDDDLVPAGGCGVDDQTDPGARRLLPRPAPVPHDPQTLDGGQPCAQQSGIDLPVEGADPVPPGRLVLRRAAPRPAQQGLDPAGARVGVHQHRRGTGIERQRRSQAGRPGTTGDGSDADHGAPPGRPAPEQPPRRGVARPSDDFEQPQLLGAAEHGGRPHRQGCAQDGRVVGLLGQGDHRVRTPGRDRAGVLGGPRAQHPQGLGGEQHQRGTRTRVGREPGIRLAAAQHELAAGAVRRLHRPGAHGCVPRTVVRAADESHLDAGGGCGRGADAGRGQRRRSDHQRRLSPRRHVAEPESGHRWTTAPERGPARQPARPVLPDRIPWRGRVRSVTVPAPQDPAAYIGEVDAPGQRPTGAGTAAFFDLDKTIVARSSALAFSRQFQAGGLINRRAVLRSAYAQLVFSLGGTDHAQMERMRAFLTALVRGWDVATVTEIVADTLDTVVDPMVYNEAVSLIAGHHAQGRDVVIVSTSGIEIVGPIGERLGVDDVVATRLEVKDGRYTGEIERYVYAEEKAVAIRELAESRGYDLARCFAYSDSVTDVPMLSAVGHAYAVNPDKDLRAHAAEVGWPVLVFSDPVGLQPTRHRAQAGSALAAVAVTGAVAAGGLAWAHHRRQHA
ncbi:HAD-IB family hydrolase [Nocardioidaceae bacterium]|nr:HAD-IB family hydrolase [Nocardioidaceae bacterium]